MTVLEWSLEYKDYKDELVDQAALMLTLSGRVKETQQVLATQFSFRLRSPDLILKVKTTQPAQNTNVEIKYRLCLCFSLPQPIGKGVVGEKMAVEISFTNPLPQVLRGVLFHVEGLGLLPAQTIHHG